MNAPWWSETVRDDADECRMASTICAIIQKKADGTIQDWAAYARKVSDTNKPVETSYSFPSKLNYDAATHLFPNLPADKYRS